MKKSKLMKKFQNFFLTNFLKGYFKAFPEKPFFSKKNFFVFCRKFGFNLENFSKHYSQLKKQVKVDPETRSYDFLTKTREKNPMSGNMPDPCPTLEYAMNLKRLKNLLLVFKSNRNFWRIFEISL